MNNDQPQASSSTAAKVSKPSGNKIVASTRQKGNPVLEHIGVAWEYGDIVVDYQVGSTTGVLYLSLKYHHLHPQYVFNRFEKLGRNYDLRILLILCDVSEHQNSIRELTKACLLNHITVMVSWSPEEAANYLKSYKLLEFRSHQMIKERVENDYSSVLRSALTTIRGMNKTDVMTLRTNFGSFKNIVHATTEDLQLCPGFGPTKVRRLQEAFNKPFYSTGQKPRGIPAQETQPEPDLDDHPREPGAHELSEEVSGDRPRAASAMPNDLGTTPSRTRHSSPEWDIEDSAPSVRPDIDMDLALDLNPTDDEDDGREVATAFSSVNILDQPPVTKRRRQNS